MDVNYTIGEVGKDRFMQFEVIIVADSNDGDYITTREFYDENFFDSHVLKEVAELIANYSDSHMLEEFHNQYLSVPYSDYGCCHSIDSIEINYYDNNGCVRPVEIEIGNKGKKEI